jgi:cell wall assembly regulator SMI1
MLSSELIRRLRSLNGAVFGQGASPQEIAQAEQELGAEFPESYRAFLLRFGWGGVEHLELYGLGQDVPDYMNLIKVTLSERTEMKPRLPHRLVPIMNDGAGNHYCLDVEYSQQGECPMVYWDHNLSVSQDPQYVARNFEAWLSAELNALQGR